MQENADSLDVKCPVCGNPHTVAVYTHNFGMSESPKTLIAYRCSDGHVFLPPTGHD
jgi:hypothetical protein